MPMVALYSDADPDACILADDRRIDLQLVALMSRVDVRVRLNADQTSRDHSLPTLKITSYGISNMPSSVPFTRPADGAETVADAYSDRSVSVSDRTLANGQESTVFTYYTYENLMQPDPAKADADVYPASVLSDPNAGDEVKQRWKPLFAKPHASAFTMRGLFTTHQNIAYEADFAIYLGADAVKDFNVRRNSCYKNNIEIRGLEYASNIESDSYRFDARVNIENDNPVYIAIVNERKIDAHATALPMDIRFLRMENSTATCPATLDISLIPDDSGTVPDWIRMEMVGADQMAAQAGVFTNSDGYPDELPPFTAGKGARRYFTANLVKAATIDGSQQPGILADNTSLTVHNNYDGAWPHEGNRTRVYFYIDENVPESNNPVDYGDRTAKVRLRYSNTDGETRETILEIDQKALLRVQASTSNGDVDAWMEYYEEYMEHKDPLDQRNMPGELYSGIQWGMNGVRTNYYDIVYATIFGKGFHDSQEVYTNGNEMTNWVLNHEGGIADVHLFNTVKPNTCFHYAAGKNKRNADGSVNSLNWYVPGISELETGLAAYYSTFSEFSSGDFYWSAAAGKGLTTAETMNREVNTRARATNVYIENGVFKHTESVEYYHSLFWNRFERRDEGSKERTEYLRVRAFYKP